VEPEPIIGRVTAPAIAIDLDRTLGDTGQLWRDWLASAARVLAVDVEALPADRGEAAAALDGAGGNWRVLLERYAEDRAPVYLRPDAAASAALRRIAAEGTRIGVFTDAPVELAQVALSQLGATRRVSRLEAGSGALDRLLAELGAGTAVIRARSELVGAAA